MERHIKDVIRHDNGLWGVAVWPGHAQELLACLDPAAPFVAFTCGSPDLGWHVAPVSIFDEPAQLRRVRNLSFTVVVEPAEAARLGPLVQASHDGSLECVQSETEPVAPGDLPAHPAGRAAVMRRSGVVLALQLPHDGEVAVVSGPVEGHVRGFAARYEKHTLHP